MKDKTTAAVLAFFLGGIGGHKFYLGQTGMGVVYLLFCWTFIPALIAFIDFIIILTMDQHTFNLRFNPGVPPQGLGQQQVQNVVVNVPPGQQPPQALSAQVQVPAQQVAAPPVQPQVAHVPPPQAIPQQQAAPAQLDSSSAIQQLKELNELRVAGVLTDEEFETQKRKLLGT